MIHENEPGVPATPFGSRWLELISDPGRGGAVYQKIDTWQPNRTYQVSMLVGNRDLLTDSNYAVELWVGGRPELAANGTSLSAVGAVQVDSSGTVEIVDNGLIETKSFRLNSGAGQSAGEPIWLRITQVARGGVFGTNDVVLFDNIVVTGEPVELEPD